MQSRRRFVRARWVSLLWLALAGVLASVSAQQPTAPPGPDKIVRAFYSWYLHDLNGNTADPLKKKATALKYLTPTLYANVPRLTRQMDADIFICAQDWSDEWAKTMTVDPPTIKGAYANTVVTLTAGSDKLRIRATLKRTAAGWRIDRVQCAQ